MPWIQSHDTLPQHPKTRRAARLAGVSVVEMIGHLHLLWWWSLAVAPDGDLSRFEAEDLADAAMFTGDAETFLRALTDCGPGDSSGFLDGMKLHDWAEYGGRYAARSAAGKAGAAARWARRSDQGKDANAMRTQCDGNGDRNAEERRGEESKPPPTPPVDAHVRRMAEARERETQERLAEMTAQHLDPQTGLAQVRSLREVRHG